MGRPPRLQWSGLHYHVIVRCNNRAHRFESAADFHRYLATLKLFSVKQGFTLFNYTLMHSHVHLFLQPSPRFLLAKTMQVLNFKFAIEYNLRKKRKGHFWIGRYTSIPVETDEYALTLMRYINRNPVRAGIVKRPGNWQWSGYNFYAKGTPNELLTPHPSYLALGQTEGARQKAYVDFVKMILPSEDKRLSSFSDANYIGSESFGRRLGYK